MSWFNVWDGLKNKTCRYLLQRYLGQFLDESLNLEQLNIELFNGKATLKNVSLRVQTLNELLEAQGWPIEFTGGHVGLLTVSVPWNALMTSDSSIEASDVVLCLRPVKRANDGTSMIESMWSSVSSSLQLAKECMRQEEEEDDFVSNGVQSHSIVGLEKFAETIDNVLNRIRAKFSNINIQIEYPSQYSLKGVALHFHLNEVVYQNETGSEKVNAQNTETNSQFDNINRIPTYAKHYVTVNGVDMFTQENYVSECDNELRNNLNYADIPVLQIKGQQNIQIKVKQSEDITGPKICFDIELGAICAILTPLQIQLLTMFLDALSEEESFGGEKNRHNISASCNNDVGPDEHNKIDNPHLAPGVYGNFNIWKSADELMVGKQSTSYNNDNLIDQNYCDSVITSISSSTITNISKFQRQPKSIDSCGEISNFTIKVAVLIGVVLHEDILVEYGSNYDKFLWNELSLKELMNVSKSFFENIENTSFDKEIEATHLFCKKNHIFLRMHPVVADGKQHRNKNILQINTKISATKFELCEILEERISHLLFFNRKKNCFDGFHVRPEFLMNISSTNTVQLRNNCCTYVEISLEENTVECDISIIDRLGTLFRPSPYKCAPDNRFKEVGDKVSSNTTELNLNCALLNVNLRFPIVDLRPLHDPNRVPWWKKNLRQDYLQLKFIKFKLNFSESIVKLHSSAIDIFYSEKDEEKHIINTRFEKTESSCEYPQIILDYNQCDNEDSKNSAVRRDTPNLPFSSQRNCRQSSTAYKKKDSGEFTENILLPGETHEINEFCERTLSNSRIQIKIYFPVIDFFFESKQLYEIIYNRLNTDLFMWEPSSPYLTKSQIPEKNRQSLLNLGLMDSVYISAISEKDPFEAPHDRNLKDTSNLYKREEKDDIDQSDNEGDDNKMPRSDGKNENEIKRHNCSVELKLGKVSGSFLVPVRDNDNRILPEICGKFVIILKDLKFFVVNGFGDDINLAFICLQIRDLELYHCGIVPMNSPLKFDQNTNVEDFMQSTIYKIPCGLTKGINANSDDKDMVSLVIEIDKIPTQNIKRLKITSGISQTTLRYHPFLPTHFWLNQLMDFMDVVDYPIEGYKPFSVISEMQLHLWDCAIDFRPDDFAYRAVIELFYFSVSSNIIPSMPSCNLRFVLEECILSVAPYEKSTPKYPCCKVSFIDSANLVPVLDLGLLDMSLRINEGVSQKCPKFDLRCSLNDVHFRSCYDSGSAFAQLLGHIAHNSNNITKNQCSKDQSLNASMDSESDLFSSTHSPVEITTKQQERVNTLMAEAVKETRESDILNKKRGERQTEDKPKLFYFPDENKKKNKRDMFHETYPSYEINHANKSGQKLVSESSAKISNLNDTLPIIKAEFGEVNDATNSIQFEHHPYESSNEEDFCIVVDEENDFINTRLDFENINISDDPLMIVDNHFCLPSCSNDLLKTPSNYPMPDQRYTLCEMTFTWHLYGGYDFSDSTDSSGEPTMNKTPMSETYRHGVSYSNESSRLHHGKKPKEKLTWKSEGGPNRNHEILVEIQFTKARFSYEIYPIFAKYASRQVLLINEIEIRDRLQSSEINKFLYNANIKSFTNRRSQHMVIVKAIQIRPNPNQINAQECSLRISMSPLRVHIDQDTLEFLTDYFINLGKASEDLKKPRTEEFNPTKSIHKPEIPIMTINDENEIPEAVQDLRARHIVSENISLLIDEQENFDKTLKNNITPAHDISSSPTYFREIIFSPDVSICFDYHGRRVELSKGPIAGLLMGLGQLQCSEIILRKIVYRRGLLGFEKVCNYLCKEWLRDIKRNQLPKILSGVGPTYAFVQLFQGIYDLFWLPIEHYQKDGRIIRGLQLGAQSFSARTILAALEITSRLIQLLQFTAETAFDMVSAGPSIRQSKSNKKNKKKRQNRPRDIREGVANAYQLVKEGINDSANNLIETATAEHDQKGLTGAVGAVMRQVPQLVVCPAVLATQATTNILGGVKSSLVPEAKLEAKEKWKVPATDLWRGVTAVSNAGKKRGRGKGTGKKIAKDLNKGQTIGIGKQNILWPGLNSPIIRGKEIVQQQRLPEDTEREKNILKLRDSIGGFRVMKVNPIDRGWSGSKMPGRSIGPPDAVGEDTFDGFDTRVLENKIVFIMKGNMGRKRRFSVMSVTGNGKGLAGFATAKAPEARTALRKSKNRAGQKLMRFELCDNRTVFHDFFCAFGKTKIFVSKKQEGYGLVCHRALQTICKVIGIRDIHAKIEGSTNLQHIVKAFFIGLLKQRSHKEIAEEKQLHLVEFRNEHDGLPHIVASPTVCRKLNDITTDEIMNFTQYVLGDKIVLKKRSLPPFYTNTIGFKLYSKKQEMLRNQTKVRHEMLMNNNELSSFVSSKKETNQ